jgi:hypothetical protein
VCSYSSGKTGRIEQAWQATDSASVPEDADGSFGETRISNWNNVIIQPDRYSLEVPQPILLIHEQLDIFPGAVPFRYLKKNLSFGVPKAAKRNILSDTKVIIRYVQLLRIGR